MNFKKGLSIAAGVIFSLCNLCLFPGASVAAADATAYIAFSDSEFSTYHWSFDDGDTNLADGQTTATVNGDGTYSVELDFSKTEAKTARNLSVLYLQISDGAEYIDSVITINSLVIDGNNISLLTPEAEVRDVTDIRVNLYNAYDNVLLFAGENYSDIQKISISFSISTPSSEPEQTSQAPADEESSVEEDGDDANSDEDNSKEEPVPNAPTFSFDMSGFAGYFSLIDADNKANIAFKQSTETRISGGSLRISCNLETELTEEGDDFEGVQIKAADFGLESFAGCKITLYAYFPTEITEYFDFAQLFANGTVDGSWVQSDLDITTSNNEWSFMVLNIPETNAADILGLKIPITNPYSGTLCYLENITITLADGSKLANVDGFDAKAAENAVINPVEKIEVPVITTAPHVTANTANSDNSSSDTIIIIVVIIVIVIAIAAIAFLIISKVKKKFY